MSSTSPPADGRDAERLPWRPCPPEEALPRLIRQRAGQLLEDWGCERDPYARALTLTMEVEDRDVAVAIVAHRQLADYLADLARDSGLSDPGAAELLVWLSSFIKQVGATSPCSTGTGCDPGRRGRR